MKELSIEAKAKAYDELFVKAQQIYNKENDVLILHTIEELFPELTKPDDKKIRKAIIGFFSEPGRKEYILNGFTVDDIIAWLEKQGEKIDAIENFDTEFEKQVSRLLASVLSKEYEYTKSFVKWVSNSLLGYAKHEIEKHGEQNPAWSEEDERNIQTVDSVIFYDKGLPEDTCMRLRNWLKSLKNRVQPQSRKEWSEEDEQYFLVCKNALAKYQTTDKWDAYIISHWLENKLKSL